MSKKNSQTEPVVTPSKVSEWVKRLLLTGAGAVFMTEEGVRSALLEMKIPKNVIAAVIAQADKTKGEISELIAREVKCFLDRIKVEDLIKKVLSGQEIEVKATIKFAPLKTKKK